MNISIGGNSFFNTNPESADDSKKNIQNNVQKNEEIEIVSNSLDQKVDSKGNVTPIAYNGLTTPFNPQRAASAVGIINIGDNVFNANVDQGRDSQSNISNSQTNQAMIFGAASTGPSTINITNFGSPCPVPYPVYIDRPIPQPPRPPEPPHPPKPPKFGPPVVEPPIVEPPKPEPPKPKRIESYPCLDEQGRPVGIEITKYNKGIVFEKTDGRYFYKNELFNLLVKNGYRGFPQNSGQLAIKYMNEGKLRVVPADSTTGLPQAPKDEAREGVDYEQIPIASSDQQTISSSIPPRTNRDSNSSTVVNNSFDNMNKPSEVVSADESSTQATDLLGKLSDIISKLGDLLKSKSS